MGESIEDVKDLKPGSNLFFRGRVYILQAHNKTGQFIMWCLMTNSPVPTIRNEYSSTRLDAYSPVSIGEIRKEWGINFEKTETSSGVVA